MIVHPVVSHVDTTEDTHKYCTYCDQSKKFGAAFNQADSLQMSHLFNNKCLIINFVFVSVDHIIIFRKHCSNLRIKVIFVGL